MAASAIEVRAGRVRLTALILGCLALALGSFWLLQVMRKDINDNTPRVLRNDPDYFVDGFTFVRLAKNGAARYVVNGAHLTHRPQDDSTEVERPLIQSFTPDRAPLVVRAETARVSQDSSLVQLDGDVRVERAAAPNAPAMKLTTTHMTVLPDDNLMRTDAPVRIDHGTSVITGVGMEANNVNRQLEVRSKVRMILRPAAH
jgi:lipopolysaccharide export system protein LptC